MATLTVICEVSTTCFRTMAWPVGSRLFTSIFFLFHLPSKKGCDFHYTKTSFIHRFLNLSVPINRFKLYLSVLKLTNIKLYSLIWVRNRYMGCSVWFWPGTYIRLLVASPMNIRVIYSSVTWRHQRIYEAHVYYYRSAYIHRLTDIYRRWI
jgi:hypothetical protein